MKALCNNLLSRIRRLAQFVLVLAAPHGFAYTAGMAIDPAFGNGGFANVPPYDATYTISAGLGFVRLPLSGGYVVFSKQTKSSVDYVVATRVNDSGAIDSSWGTGGQVLYGMPAPSGTDAFVVLGIEGGVERIYLVARYVSGIGYLTVATFGTDGSFENFNSYDVSDSFAGYGVGEVLAVNPGTSTTGNPGILVAVRGATTASGYIAFVGASTASGVPGTIDHFSYVFTRPSFRINWMQDRGDGKTDMLGTEGNQALYLRFKPTTGSIEAETYFNLPCDSGLGFTTSSVADGFVHPATFGGDALVTGRVACSSGDAYSVAARVSAIETAPSVLWGTRLEYGFNSGLSGGACLPPFSSAGCFTANIDYSSAADPGEAFVNTTYPAITHLDLGGAPAPLSGADFDVTAPFVLPSFKYGSDYQYPYIVALADTATQLGLARVAVDRVFADRFDQTP